MSVSFTGLFPISRGPRSGQRFAALAWALLHVPIFLWLFAPGIGAAVRATPEAYRLWLWPTFLPQATLLALVGWALSLPFSRGGRYRFIAPAAIALVTGVVALDARIYHSVGFHLNGFFFRFLLQPNALTEAGVPLRDVLVFLSGVLALAIADVAAGAWFIRRFATGRRSWATALGLLLLCAAERTYGAMLTHFGGPAIFAASMVLPLQPPVRMSTIARRIFGKREQADPFAGTSASKRLPAGVAPDAIRFARTPDVLFVVAESLPADHLSATTMPGLWRRAAHGARFERHYAGASSTNYTLFTLMYGLQAQKLEATVGAGRRPVLFPALAAGGYQMKVLSASCVNWMDLKDTVFGGIPEKDLQTWCEEPKPPQRDETMIAAAEAFTAQADPARPVFLFLFFFGTHFNYFHDDPDRVHLPEWDGVDALKATAAPGEHIANRARNAAHKLDRVIDGFLTRFEAMRGKAPLVVFTGDHGEEFRQKGHLGHGSAVTSEQIHVPAVWLGPGVPEGLFSAPTSHADVVPTLLSLLGDEHPPSLYADGQSMFSAPADRFVTSTVGWEPRYAVIGTDLKVTMYAGLGTATITDPFDQPLPDGAQRMARSAGKILRALRGEAQDPSHASAAR